MTEFMLVKRLMCVEMKSSDCINKLADGKARRVSHSRANNEEVRKN